MAEDRKASGVDPLHVESPALESPNRDGAQDDRAAGVDSFAAQPRLQRIFSNRQGEIQRPSFSQDGSGNTIGKKPSMSRRGSSSRQLPIRGQGFSVDDAQEEIDRELALYRQARHSSGMSIRQHSTIRRRPGLHARGSLAEGPEEEDPAETSQQGQPQSKPPSETPVELSRQRTSTASQRRSGSDDDADDDDGGHELAEEMQDEEETTPANEDEDLSDTESFTLKDRQEAINETHPFGIRIWKPALYKKGRSVEKSADGDINSSPGGFVSGWLWLFNLGWTLLFGWWLALVAAAGGLLCLVFVFAPGCREYGRVLWGLAAYLLYPFGKYVKLIQEEAYAHEDRGEGRSISEYEQWQNGDLEEGRLFFGPVRSLIGRRRSDEDSEDGNETASLLGRHRNASIDTSNNVKTKRRLFGRGQWNVGRVIYFIIFYGLLTPLLFTVSMVCWLGVFTLPMGRVTLILLDHLRRHPLAMEFHHDTTYTRGPNAAPASIILCTYRAVGIKYWKYTVDGTNIFLINLLGVVAFSIFDYFVLYKALGLEIALTNTIFVFLLSLFSIIPLAYFIGQAVASISAQSTMGVGAAINAFFSTVVEVFLYCVALSQGKAQLVEGSIVGSIFAGILLLPGISMCFGAIRRKTQRFNVKSAGVTSTMLLFAVIGAFGPTLFYQIYGAHELNCQDCSGDGETTTGRDCRRCFFAQAPAVSDPFYETAVRPYIYFSAVLLFLSYCIGTLFTLRTHAATIWNIELDEKKVDKADSLQRAGLAQDIPKSSAGGDYGAVQTSRAQQSAAQVSRSDIRESQLYKRILGQSLKQAGLPSSKPAGSVGGMFDGPPDSRSGEQTLMESTSLAESISSLPDADDAPRKRQPSLRIPGLSDEDSKTLVRQMAEMAATAATVATRDATAAPRRASYMATHNATTTTPKNNASRSLAASGTLQEAAPAAEVAAATGAEAAAGGHDAPNWSRKKSYVILLTATIAYAIIAEILVDTVDAVLVNVDIDEKFLGITLFALVPNTTEFLNAISFAMNGNIALSMEIGSAYALQVCLLQVPALVLFSAVYGRWIPARAGEANAVIDHTFSMVFPQWDMVTVILCVFLLSYMYGEGKSNYFKGSILILSYLVVVVGFYMAAWSDQSFDSSAPRAASSRLRTMPGRGAVVL